MVVVGDWTGPRHRRPFAWTLACLSASLWCAACSALNPLPAPSPAVAFRERTITLDLHGTAFELHLATPATPHRPAALVLFATGDGGWFGTAVGMFSTIAKSGYPAVGFSARSFLKIERPAHAALDPHRLANDYATILARARTELALPQETPAILTGWSRGAAFAVLAAAEMPSHTDAAGIVALGLAAGENLRIDGPEDETDDDSQSTTNRDSTAGGTTTAGTAAGGTTGSESWPFAPYDTLVHRLTIPRAVIQATGDRYLPAARARTLFGADTPDRRLWEIPGHNHRFSGAERAMVDALSSALAWAAQHAPGV
jgi:alpha-beta hydrolase superfamily lysophospholipase